MKLQNKIILTIAVLLALCATAGVAYVQLRFSGQLRAELEKRGISIARNLAQHSTASMLARDRLALKMIAVAQLRSEDDIVYIFFVGPRGQTVLAHTFGETFPEALLTANPLPPGDAYQVRNLQTEAGAVYDIAMPVAGGGLGQVRVGLSAAPVTLAVQQFSGEILLVLALLGTTALLLSLPLSASITRPVAELMTATDALARGDFSRQVPLTSRDEIGQLGRSFNRMVEQLQSARHALLERQAELAAEIDHRRDAETRLAAQLNLISILLDEIPTPVFFKDVAGIYQGCNRAFEAFTGISRNELCGQTVAAFLPPAEAAIHSQADCDLFSHPGSSRYELAFTNRQGVRHEVIFQKATYNSPDGALAGMVGILIDVTRDREIDRLRNDFVSTTAHEFQTPLTAILGFSELLLADAHTPLTVQREYLEIIRERSEYLSRLVDRFLDVSRIDNGRPLPLDPQPCYPDQLLRRILQSHMTRESRHRFELHLPPQPPAILVDEVRFAEVVENLLANAQKYAPAGSLVLVEGAVAAPDHFVITVTDQGPGLTNEQRARIFDKFYRVDSSNNAPSGTGLGLYLSRAIVQAHHGTLDVTDAPNGGCCFVVTIPLAPTEHTSAL